MEGAEITLERLEHVTRALATSRLRNQVFSAFLGRDHRARTSSPTRPTSSSSSKTSSGRSSPASSAGSSSSACATSAIHGTPVSSSKATFGDIGSAGGHRAMAKAVVPFDRFRAKFGDLSGVGIAARIGELVEEFLEGTGLISTGSHS